MLGYDFSESLLELADETIGENAKIRSLELEDSSSLLTIRKKWSDIIAKRRIDQSSYIQNIERIAISKFELNHQNHELTPSDESIDLTTESLEKNQKLHDLIESNFREEINRLREDLKKEKEKYAIQNI